LYCFLVGCEIKVKLYMMSITCFQLCFALLGPAATGTGTIALDPLGPTFGSFTLLEPDFTLSKLVSLVKMFRLFRSLEPIFLGCSECEHSK
jgi:hypothetical protein